MFKEKLTSFGLDVYREFRRGGYRAREAVFVARVEQWRQSNETDKFEIVWEHDDCWDLGDPDLYPALPSDQWAYYLVAVSYQDRNGQRRYASTLGGVASAQNGDLYDRYVEAELICEAFGTCQCCGSLRVDVQQYHQNDRSVQICEACLLKAERGAIENLIHRSFDAKPEKDQSAEKDH